MAKVDTFPPAQLETIARILGGCGTGSEIDRVFRELDIQDKSGESTKWKRLYWWFDSSQRQFKCGTHVLAFIRRFLARERFVGRSQEFEEARSKLNQVLAFAGIEYGDDGEFRKIAPAKTLSEAEKRAQTIRAKLQGRQIHPEVVKYCRAELMQDNYFHAVFEAAKGLAQRIREMTGVQLDGAALVDKVFVLDRPLLAFNRLETETEKSEHKGFATLLKGCFAAIRNPLAHEPKILWEGEEDAADYLTLISLLHRKLDSCFRRRFAHAP
jgi:uncharacterized protein (TIGR02391 family)